MAQLKQMGIALFVAAFASSAQAASIHAIASGLQVNGAKGVATAPDGTVYIVATENHRVVKVAVDGTVTNYAGTGAPGDVASLAAEGVAATTLPLRAPTDVAIDFDGGLLIADAGNHRIRKVLSDGTMVTVVGLCCNPTGASGNAGYNGPSVAASAGRLNNPQGIAVDPRNNDLLIADTNNRMVRRLRRSDDTLVDLAGSTSGISNVDGTVVTARFQFPTRLHVATNGDILVIDNTSQGRVAHIDGAHTTVTTVAGKGATVPAESGPSVGRNYGLLRDVGWIDTTNAYFVNDGRAWKLTLGSPLSSSTASAYAGQTTGGDVPAEGGEALTADFGALHGVLSTGGGFAILADNARDEVWEVWPPTPFDVIVELLMNERFMQSLEAIEGSLVMVEVDGRTFLIMPELATVGGDVQIVGNDDLAIVDLTALAAVGGSLVITDNLVVDALDLLALAEVVGTIDVSVNPSLTNVDAPLLTSVGGDVTISEDTSLTSIDAPALQTVGGDFSIDGDVSLTTLDA